MAVIRIEKTKNYTVMSNYHLRDKELSCKACGLLSKMLSLPENWDFSARGLAAICKDGITSIRSGLKELEECGYLIRRNVRDAEGRVCDIEYVIYEMPYQSEPVAENLTSASLTTENRTQSNTIINKILNRSNIHQSINQEDTEIGQETMKPASCQEREKYAEMIRDNIQYDDLCYVVYPSEELDEIVNIMTDVVCSRKPYYKINGENMPTEVIKSKFLKLGYHQIENVLEARKKLTSPVKNPYNYLIAMLFNVRSTMENEIVMDLSAAGVVHS